jgi:hypothetical protein
LSAGLVGEFVAVKELSGVAADATDHLQLALLFASFDKSVHRDGSSEKLM